MARRAKRTVLYFVTTQGGARRLLHLLETDPHDWIPHPTDPAMLAESGEVVFEDGITDRVILSVRFRPTRRLDPTAGL